MSASVRKNRRGDDAIALALAAGKTEREAAAAANLSDRTVRRRLADPEFVARVAQTRGEMVGRAVGKLADGMVEASAKLRELLSAESETVRLGACRALLELGVRLRESVVMEARLAAIEDRLAKGKK